MKPVIIITLFLVSVCICAKLPPTFKKCNKNQTNINECLSKAVKDAVEQLDQPFPEMGLPSLNPLEVPSMTIGAGSGPVQLVQNYKNAKIYGFSKPETMIFEIDLDNKTALIEGTFAEVKMVAEYDINGKILLLPVYGKGPASVILGNPKGSQTFKFEEYEKKGRKYLKVVDSKLILTPKFVTIKLDNLFNGNKLLGDNINTVINENWEEAFSDVKSNYEEAFGQIIESLFNNLLARVPLDELFEQ